MTLEHEKEIREALKTCLVFPPEDVRELLSELDRVRIINEALTRSYQNLQEEVERLRLESKVLISIIELQKQKL